MAIIATTRQHRFAAEELIRKSEKLLEQIERQGQGDLGQMQTDLQAITAMSTLATAHAAMATYLEI